MNQINKPFLVIPKLIEQPTWGGTYIAENKSWSTLEFLDNRKFGQSYELFGGSKLALTCTDTASPSFIPEVGFADRSDILTELFPKQNGVDYILLSDLVSADAEQLLGPRVAQTYHGMKLLIKFTQAKGNSFQLHVRPSVKDTRWQPKAESWYYLAPGKITFGIKAGTDPAQYEQVCKQIELYMKDLGAKVQAGSIAYDDAHKEAHAFVTEKNPWQFVNVHTTENGSAIDLSGGGIHHSWEDPGEANPLGNILYEVQQDVMDPVCTIRSFDQGKIGTKGEVRDIHIADYFKYLDTDPARNDLATATRTVTGNSLFATPLYCVDRLRVSGTREDGTGMSFVHLFVSDGDIDVVCPAGEVRVGRGHSAFIPYAVGTFTIRSRSPQSTVLKTFME